MKRNCQNTGFSLMELIIVLLIVAILMALTIPVSNRIKEKYQATQCISNIRTLYSGIMAYGAEHQGKFPENTLPGSSTTKSWYIPLRDYIPGESGRKVAPYFCPANPADPTLGSGRHTNYAINAWLYEEQEVPNLFPPSLRFPQLAKTKALLMDSYEKDAAPLETWYTQSGRRGGWTFAEAVHGNRVNIIFTDGHVESPLVEPRLIDAKGNLQKLQTQWFWPVKE